jgi:homopolymeric O-antigen transport system ATP-binding protein
MSSIIRVEQLSKKYLIGHQPQERYTALRDVLADGAKRAAGRLLHPGRPAPDRQHEEFWALRDVSFDIQQGDRVGIIGRNGAGKSTLLKVLSRITEPTEGRVTISGRAASLLEVGTGFHPELTGRENIFLNGAILGMSRAEIKKKFDEIVAFAEVERFLDTPVKRYSSGMYVRLAFAVAAHLEPEILIVDEVLAVGDAQFQKKCLGKMEDAGRQGRTVLFVSHNMAMISNLCQKGLVMQAGRLAFQGPISEAVLKYYDASEGENAARKGYESETAALLGAEVTGASRGAELTLHDELAIRMRYRIKRTVAGRCVPNFHFFAADGSCIFVSNAPDVGRMPPGEYLAECVIPPNLLNEGTYFVGVALTTYSDEGSFEIEYFDRNALSFNVVDPMDDRSNRYGYAGPMPGVVRPRLSWNISEAAL